MCIRDRDKEWEYTFERAPYAALFSDGIWYDESEQKFKDVYKRQGI